MNPNAIYGDPIDILYIIGSGRSGSTLLSSLLGTQTDFVSVGEIYNYRHFFDTGQENDRHCSCGSRLDECSYWKEVNSLTREQTGNGTIDLKYGEPSMLVKQNHAMFSAIRQVSGKRIIIDSCKRFNRLQMLLKSPRFRITILHLVRDGRAFAYSTMMSAMRRKLPHNRYFFRRLLKWQNKNIGIRLAFGRMPSYHMVRYEDFVRNPDKVLGEITGWFGMTFDRVQLDSQDKMQVHEFSGNREFFSRKSLEIRQDTRYLEHLNSAQWVLSTTLAAPALRLYSYPFRRPGFRT